jgi:uncharacterized protein (UPF0332 family)
MTPEREALARHRMARARETFAAANRLRDESSFADAANRYYYAGFHAARAVLAAAGLHAAGHNGTIINLQRHFVKMGRIDIETAKALPRAFQLRQTADYDDFPEITAVRLDETHTEVAAFLAAWESLLDELVGEEPGS